MRTPRGSFPRYLLAAVLVVALGLASRRFPEMAPGFLGKYPGDALWALLVFLCWGCVFRRWDGEAWSDRDRLRVDD